MRGDFRKRLASGTVLFDGATGTTLQRMGLPVGMAPERWIYENPEAVYKNHRGYVEAGADVVLTNTLGANGLRFKESENSMYDMNARAAALARKAAGDNAYVAGSVGPTGLVLMMGEVSDEQVITVYKEQIQGLLEGGIDIVAVETMTDIEEACLAVQAAKELTNNPLIATLTFEPGKHGFHTVMGNTVETVVRRLEEAGVDATGSNCGTGIDTMIDIIAEMRKHTKLPLLAEPNAGLPEIEEGKIVYRESAEFMASKVPDLLAAGARLIGGCCGTTFEHIRLFRRILTEYQD